MRTASKPNRNPRSGNAVLEFALVFGLLWLLLSGAFRVGYSIYVYQLLENAVAGAARYAARVDFDAAHTFAGSVQKMAVYGSPSGGTVPLAPGLNTGNVSVTWTVDGKGVPLTITVAIANYSVNSIFRTFTWSGKPAMTVRYAGTYKS